MSPEEGVGETLLAPPFLSFCPERSSKEFVKADSQTNGLGMSHKREQQDPFGLRRGCGTAGVGHL